ncbi:10427_t:CDS:1, partial [Racocetra fulgida]
MPPRRNLSYKKEKLNRQRIKKRFIQQPITRHKDTEKVIYQPISITKHEDTEKVIHHQIFAAINEDTEKVTYYQIPELAK